ncbi:hypothetical protein SAMN03159488_00745 [Pseudomonas sp. NFIX10]|nr:hypothetical protein SAMN03159488_00745 [Pseudomonas sp. NFIX10]SFE29907.1 hypothetical protein SAMN03159367_00879 [Pseudomonas sp. NFACC06-1]
MLRVGMQPGTLRVPKPNAERPLKYSHAERGNNHVSEAAKQPRNEVLLSPSKKRQKP